MSWEVKSRLVGQNSPYNFEKLVKYLIFGVFCNYSKKRLVGNCWKSHQMYSKLQANLDKRLTAQPVGLGCWFLYTSEFLDQSVMPEKAGLIRPTFH